MPNMIANGLAWLEGQRKAHMADDVLYLNGHGTYTVSATFGRTDYLVEDADGVQTGAVMFDFIIPGDALGDVKPKPGDRIETGSAVYEVVAFGSDNQGWRWTSPHRESLRVHTQEIGTP